jgi:hypothetical protein
MLCRLHDGELGSDEAETLRSQLTDEEQQKLAALAEVDALVANTLTAEAQANDLDLWAGIADKLPGAAPASAKSKVLPFLRRRTIQVTAILGTLAAAASLVLLLRPSAYPSNHCEIEELDVAGQNATVISVPDEHGHETALIWFDHQETDEWESL